MKIVLRKSILLCGLALAFSNNLFAQKTLPDAPSALALYSRTAAGNGEINTKKSATDENGKPGVSTENTAEKISNFEKTAFALINQKRLEIGLEPLAWSEDVAKIARLHSANMVKFGFFSHRGQDGKMVNDRADALGVTKWSGLGENIAYNRGFKDPIATAVEKWMLSPGHRENLLNRRWKESAVGIAVTADGTYYFTQVFMVRR